MMFISAIKQKHEEKHKIKSKTATKYKKLLMKVVTKIEKWHQREQEKRKGRFENDEDFIEQSPSPDRFEVSSASSEDF